MDQEELEEYIGSMIRITGPKSKEPFMVKLLAVEPDRLFVAGDDGNPFWLSLNEIKIGQ